MWGWDAWLGVPIGGALWCPREGFVWACFGSTDVDESAVEVEVDAPRSEANNPAAMVW